MDEVLAALTEQQEELDQLLRGLDPAGWERPTRCPGWTVADVVLHLAQTDELVVAGAEGRFAEAVAAAGWSSGAFLNVDDAAGAAVAAERGAPPDRVHARWRAAAAGEREALGACDRSTRLPWVAGDLPARTLATTRLAETWIHTGDVAEALGVKQESSDRLWHIARLAWRTLPYAFARAGRQPAGPVRLTLEGPAGTTWDFEPDGDAVTSVSGSALEFCLVAGRRLDGSAATSLTATGPDGDAVLELVRTFA